MTGRVTERDGQQRSLGSQDSMQSPGQAVQYGQATQCVGISASGTGGKDAANPWAADLCNLTSGKKHEGRLMLLAKSEEVQGVSTDYKSIFENTECTILDSQSSIEEVIKHDKEGRLFKELSDMYSNTTINPKGYGRHE